MAEKGITATEIARQGGVSQQAGFTYNNYLETVKSLVGQFDLLMKKPAVVSEGQMNGIKSGSLLLLKWVMGERSM